MEDGDVELSHLVVSQRAVRQLHVDVPRWVGHHHRKFPQDGHVQVADVTANPLQRKKALIIIFGFSLFTPSSLLLLSSPHLGRKQFAHIAVCIPCAESKLRGPSLGPYQVSLSLRRAVNLVVDILARVHVETSVEEGAVAEALVRVLVDDTAAGTDVRSERDAQTRLLYIMFRGH